MLDFSSHLDSDIVDIVFDFLCLVYFKIQHDLLGLGTEKVQQVVF